jgi:hypothetical protein
LHCILAVSSDCEKDLEIIAEGMVEESGALKNAQKRLFHLQRLTCLRITGGMRSIPTSALEVMLMLPPLHLFIKQESVSSKVVLQCGDSLQKLALSFFFFFFFNKRCLSKIIRMT